MLLKNRKKRRRLGMPGDVAGFFIQYLAVFSGIQKKAVVSMNLLNFREMLIEYLRLFLSYTEYLHSSRERCKNLTNSQTTESSC